MNEKTSRAAREAPPKEAGETDLDLARAAAVGDAGARVRLVARLYDGVHRVAACMAGPGCEADDVSQVALVEILRCAASYRGESSLEHWADRIVVRIAGRRLGKSKRRRDLEGRYLEPLQRSGSVDGDVDGRRVAMRLAELLQRIHPDQRAAIVLHHVQGYSVGQIAEITHAPFDTVKHRIRVGTAKLREMVRDDPMLGAWIERG